MLIKLWGKIKQGDKRGRKLGFPTANISLHKNIPQGIYISYAKVNKKYYPSLTFIGNAKTYNLKQVKAECFILNFNKDIYRQWISITLIKKIRTNMKFTSEDKLINQMQKDLLEAKKYFKIT